MVGVAGGFVTRSFESMLKECVANKKYAPLQKAIQTCLDNMKETNQVPQADEKDQTERAKYKKMIRLHIDFQMIILKISRGLISSPKELLRDLLLLVNNTLVFYHKGSVEHKSALTLRELAIKSLRQCSEYPAESFKNSSASSSPAVKARNVWPAVIALRGKRGSLTRREALGGQQRAGREVEGDHGRGVLRREERDLEADATADYCFSDIYARAEACDEACFGQILDYLQSEMPFKVNGFAHFAHSKSGMVDLVIVQSAVLIVTTLDGNCRRKRYPIE
ncbi:hypothetical protein ACMD2_15462, partial [Ananas comosus]